MKKALLTISLLLTLSVAVLTACNTDKDEPSDVTVSTSDTTENNSTTSDENKSDDTDEEAPAQTTGSSSETTDTNSSGGSDTGNISGGSGYVDPSGEGYTKNY